MRGNLPEPADDHDRKLLADVERHGWHVIASGDVFDGFNVCFRTVEQRHYREHLGYAGWFYRGGDFPALQCVWPDSHHRYPWHPEAGSDFLRRQPVLSDDSTWPFHEGKNRAVFTTRPVLKENLPILLVSHDSEGDWQFLCGTTNRTGDAKIVSLGCVFERDSTLAEIADLPDEWWTDRQARGHRGGGKRPGKPDPRKGRFARRAGQVAARPRPVKSRHN